MDERKKLMDLLFGCIEKSDYACEICSKMGYDCKVVIPEDADSCFKPDYSLCDFKARVYKTLTIEH